MRAPNSATTMRCVLIVNKKGFDPRSVVVRCKEELFVRGDGSLKGGLWLIGSGIYCWTSDGQTRQRLEEE